MKVKPGANNATVARPYSNLRSNYDMTTDNNRILRRAVRLAMLSGGTLATGLATSTSIGQTQPAPANEQTEGAAPITEVVVTGSRIVTPSLESVSPVIAVTS
ncbi:MAG: hypothetical protein JO274_08210, partial [Gammaproteobacteria bacterium]|nr:hypothetical protein [Gammaproteobacteria bacterium]